MVNITIHAATTKNPISLMGEMAGICWGAPTDNIAKNKKRGWDCIKSGHGRVLEFPQIYLIIDESSARVMREFYTHIAGGPTRLQASTRYIEYGDFEYITPRSIAANPVLNSKYDWCMHQISETYKDLEAAGAKKEDIANILPLGMETKVVVRMNLRMLIEMCRQRMCMRAYWEFRDIMRNLCCELSDYSDEWAELRAEIFKPKCDVTGWCEEKQNCGRHPKKEDVMIVSKKDYERMKASNEYFKLHYPNEYETCDLTI